MSNTNTEVLVTDEIRRFDFEQAAETRTHGATINEPEEQPVDYAI